MTKREELEALAERVDILAVEAAKGLLENRPGAIPSNLAALSAHSFAIAAALRARAAGEGGQ